MKKSLLLGTVIFLVLFASSFCLAEKPAFTLRVDYYTKYLVGSGSVVSERANLQPNLELRWKNGVYLGFLGFTGFHGYNRNYSSENDFYGGYTWENIHLKVDVSYWYFMVYDLNTTTDDSHDFTGRFFWKSCPGVTPYLHLEYSMPVKKDRGSKEGWQWRIGAQKEVETKYVPIKFDLSLRGSDGANGLRPGMSCAMFDVSLPFPIKSLGITIEPNTHYRIANGDPDGPGKGFKGKNGMWWSGVAIIKRF